MSVSFIAAMLVALLCVCSGDPGGPAAGAEGGPCYPNGTCNGDLVCRSDLCVELETCGDGTCGSTEDHESCPQDCTEETCGNGSCDEGEDHGSCPADCPDASCGNGTCDVATGEAPDSCPSDCPVGSCGNGVLDEDEECDGSALGGATCATLDLGGGDLKCTGECLYDVSLCTGPVCGNGVVEGSEQCDDGAANSDTVANACRTDCTLSGCGDGVVDSGEVCDGAARNGQTCQTLGYVTGTLGCTTQCQFDVSLCEHQDCGNGVQEGTEECDAGDLDGETCESLGFTGGTLACDLCLFVTSDCYACGNGTLEPGEACDDGNVADDVDCASDCMSYCGDGTADTSHGEACDTDDLAGATCVGQGFTGGVPTCAADCTVDPSTCTLCGNHQCEAGETHATCPADCAGAMGVTGDACSDANQCGGITNGTPSCLTSLASVITFTGGYCSSQSCTADTACDSGNGMCVSIMGFMSVCLQTCTQDTECRESEGYSCTTLPIGGDSRTYCLPGSGTNLGDGGFNLGDGGFSLGDGGFMP